MREKLTHDLKLNPSKCTSILNGLNFLELSPGNILPGDKLNFYATPDGIELIYHDIIHHYGMVTKVDKTGDKYIVTFNLTREVT